MTARVSAESVAGLERFAFGDSAALADALLALVIAGRKTATCWSAHHIGPSEPGERSVVLDGKGIPRAVIETVEIRERHFAEVDAAFARDEGEGDLSLDFWRRAHRDYFERNGGWEPDMMLVCERFRVVEVL